MIDYHNHDASLGEGAFLGVGRGIPPCPPGLSLSELRGFAKHPELKNPSRTESATALGKDSRQSYDPFYVRWLRDRWNIDIAVAEIANF